MPSNNRILIIGTFHFPYGTAPASRIRNLAIGFEQNGFHVDILALSPPPGREESINKWYNFTKYIRYQFLLEKQNQNINFREKIEWYFHNWKLGGTVSQIANQLIRDIPYQAFFFYGRYYSFFRKVIAVAKNNNIPIISDVVELPKTFSSIFYFLHPVHIDQHLGLKQLIKESALILSITTFLRDYIAHPRRTYLLPAIQDWSNVTIHNSQFIDYSGIINITYVGSLIDRDQPDLMFKFIRLLLSNNLKVRLNLVGRFANKQNGREWVKRVKLDESLERAVNIIGEVSETQKKTIFKNTHTFILPRREHADEIAAFPTRIVEFMLEKKLLVASPVGDIPKYFSDKEIFYLNEQNIEQSIKNFMQVIENVVERNEMLERSFEKAKEKFSGKNHVKNIVRIINLIQKKKNRK